MNEYEVEIDTGAGKMDTFICHPDENGPHPAVIIYMDAPAIREELRDMARRLGTAGYYVALPNLYYREGREGSYGFDYTCLKDDEQHLSRMFGLMSSLSNEMIVNDTQFLIETIRNDLAAAAGPIGCAGYCMSGQFVAAVGAAYPDDFAAIASYYGVGILTDKEDSPHLSAGKIKGELYMAFAEEDPYVPQEVLDALPAAMEACGVNYRIEIYPGTEHGFAFPERPAYIKAAGERHWERMLALFDRQLKNIAIESS
jgi:carboxymethylenebutenolidase